MFTTVLVLMVFVSVFMVIAVLVQKSKGGGLNQSFASQTQLVGVRKSSEFIVKATWTFAVAMFVFSLAAVAFLPTGSVLQTSSDIDEALPRVETSAPVPTFDAQAPVMDVEDTETPAE